MTAPTNIYGLAEAASPLNGTPSQTAVAVGVATTVALAANTARRYAMLINDSDAVMYAKLGSAAVLNTGIRLNPNGGSYEMSAEMGNLYTGAINVIHGATGTKNLLIEEGT